MIYTCTLNPSVDYFVSLEDLQLGRTNVSNGERKVPGGKGINVSRVLKNLGLSSTAYGFLGGFTGTFIRDELSKEEIVSDFIEVHGDTRINLKLNADAETEINGLGPEIAEDQIYTLYEKIRDIDQDDVLVLSGSIPKSMDSSIYEKILSQTPKGVLTVVDSKGEALAKALNEEPFLIKPNHHELGELFDTTITNSEEAASYAKRLVELGAKNVIVSMAGKGALFVNQELVLQTTVPKGHVKNSVGAGDSVVAGFITSYLRHKDLTEAFQFGVAAGSASAFSKEFCTKEQISELIKDIQIKPLGGRDQ